MSRPSSASSVKMSSSSIYLAPGSCLRLRRYPRASLSYHVPHTHTTKRLLQHTIRSCSGWRRNGPYWLDDRSKRQKIDNESRDKRDDLPKDDPQHEPSRREKMWQERIDRIRRMVEHDPYEALFGYSNRLLKGMRRDWPLDAHNRWWQKEMSFTVRSPFAGQRIEMEAAEATEKAESEAAKATKSTAAEVEPEPELEYDPISNRMIRKAGRSPSPYGDGNMATARHHSRSRVAAEEDNITHDEAVETPIKSYRPRSGKPEPSTRSPPTFTMLKEDIPHESMPQADPEPTSSARAEYEQYKAERLREAERSSQWLESEGFRDSKLESNSTAGLRNNLEKRFDDLHSGSQDLAEERLIDKRPWEAQRSKGTKVSAVSTFAAWRQKAKIPAYDEARADQEIHDYTMQLAGDNLKNKQAVEEANTTNKQDKKPYSPLVHPLGDVQAEKDIRDYATQVASGNLKTKRLAELRKTRQETDEHLADMRRRQLEEFNKETRRLAEERARNDEAKKELQDVKATVLDTKAKLAKYESHLAERSSSALQTSLQRHQDKSAVAQSHPLKTSLQRLNNSTSEVVLKPEQSLLTDTEQRRTHDPVGYNHTRESSSLQQLTTSKKPLRVPSLAEVFGYRKAKDEGVKTVGKHEIDPSAEWLLDEIESQKAAFNRFESSRKQADDASSKDTETSATEANSSITQRVSKEIEQKKQDAALVREIRHIYEDKYGPITTSHTQPVEAVAPAIETPQLIPRHPEPVVNATTSQKPKLTEETPSPIPELPAEKPQTEKEPASILSTPTPSKIAKYTILAYDSKSKNMTTATFESIPSATETGIPATIALRHLAYANRFLPKLIELQHRGFVPVHAERNLLILRQDGAKTVGTAERGFEAGEEDPVQSERFVDISENDGGAAREPKRLEPVFSGSHGKNRERAWWRWKESQRQESQRRRRRFGRAVQFTAGGVVLSGAVVYLAGVGAEVRQNRGRGKVIVTGDDVPRGARRE